jgi:hypothetical protein
MALASFIPVAGATIAAVLGIGVAIAAIAAAWATWSDRIKAFFVAIPGWVAAIDWKAVGIRIVTAIADGIWSAATLPARAMEAIVGKVRSYLPFSPAKAGPLRDLNRVRIVQTIADTMTPTPMLTAMRRVAMVTALAAPMIAGAGAPAMAGGQASRAGSNTSVTINFTVNRASADFERDIEKHGRKIADVIKRELDRKARADF